MKPYIVSWSEWVSGGFVNYAKTKYQYFDSFANAIIFASSLTIKPGKYDISVYEAVYKKIEWERTS